MVQQETSALFSLGELMRIEQERIREEAELAERQVEAQERARRDAEARAREHEHAQLRLEEDLRSKEEARRRDEAARIEAIKQGELERIRFETEQQARLSILAREHEHQRQMAVLLADASKKKLTRALRLTLIVSVVAASGSVALYYGRLEPEARRRTQGLESIIAAERAETEKTAQTLEAVRQKATLLEEQLRAGRSLAEKATTPVASPEVPGPSNVVRKRPPLVAPVRAAPKAACKCDEHDPLCGCFKER